MAGLTLEDIAKKAGVSRSTVSRVVNNHPNVSNAVRERVQEVIRETGYHPNAAARTLASQRSWMIGLILPRTVSSFFNEPYYPRLTQGIASACNQYNFTLSLFLVTNQEDEEKIFSRISRRGFLDGVVVQSAQYGDQLIDHLLEADIPTVIIGRPFHSKGVSFVDIDNVDAAKTAVNHLASLGYKRIATLAALPTSTVGRDRKKGYLQALAENNLPIDESLIVEVDFTEEEGYQAMKKLLPSRPEAVFAASDLIALGAIRAVKEAGLRVPEDVAFVGFDDLPLPTAKELQLTTIRQSVGRLGRKAVETLVELIESGQETVRTQILETQLIVRSSCGGSKRTGTNP